MSAKLACFLSLMVAAAVEQAHAAAVGTAFTYQGSLYDNDQPANGTYDLQFKLFDAAGNGSQVGGTASATDVQVFNGLFTASLFFGPEVYDGDARWLEVAVFDPGSSQYVTLSPRQRLAPAPYAVHALGSAQWQSEGTAVTNANAGFVGINRSTPVTGSEYFGVQAPVSGSGYGGMYIRTDSASARPFYGYSTGTESAWTYLDGATGHFRIHNGGDRVTVTDSGNVGIDTVNPTGRLHVLSPSQPAGLFEITSASSFYAAVSGLTIGPGTAVSGRNNGSGRAGSFLIDNASNSAPALEGITNGSGPAIYATNTGSGPALRIQQGHIEVQGAGENTTTPIFIHVATSATMDNPHKTIIDHPLCNNRPDAIVMISEIMTLSSGHDNPVGAYYSPVHNKWTIWSTADDQIENHKFAVLVVHP